MSCKWVPASAILLVRNNSWSQSGWKFKIQKQIPILAFPSYLNLRTFIQVLCKLYHGSLQVHGEIEVKSN